MRRMTLAVVALAIPISAASLTFAGPAGAAPHKATKAASAQTCTKVTGTISGNLTFSGCTGGLGKGSALATSLQTGGTITWQGKGKGGTSFSMAVSTPSSNGCSKGFTEYDGTGTVTADTSKKVAIGSSVSARACVDLTTGAVTLVKHTNFSL